MNIDKDLLSEMGACDSGMRWFLTNFKGDAPLEDVIKLLLRDGRGSDSAWLNSRLLMRDDMNVKAFTEANVAAVIEYTDTTTDLSRYKDQITSSHHCAKIGSSDNHAQIATSVNHAKIGSSGNCVKIASSGDYPYTGSSSDYAQIAVSGNLGKIAATGDYAQISAGGDFIQIASSGYGVKIASSGYSVKIASSGDYAQIASSDDNAKIQAQGENAVIAITGSGMAKAAEGGVIAIQWFDEQSNRSRIAVGYVGEDLSPDTWYKVDNKGSFVEVTG